MKLLSLVCRCLGFLADVSDIQDTSSGLRDHDEEASSSIMEKSVNNGGSRRAGFYTSLVPRLVAVRKVEGTRTGNSST